MKILNDQLDAIIDRADPACRDTPQLVAAMRRLMGITGLDDGELGRSFRGVWGEISDILAAADI